MRCSPRRRSPTARSLTHKPPSRLTSSVWKRLHRRSRWSGPPQTAPPHGSTDAGDDAGDEVAAAASGGGEATQRHNTLLTIGREAGAPGGEENAEDEPVSSDCERGIRNAGKLAGGAASGSPAPPLLPSMATPPGASPASHRPGLPRGGAPEDCPYRPGHPRSIERAGRFRLSLGPIQTERGGDWLSRAEERNSRRDRQKSCDWQIGRHRVQFPLRNCLDFRTERIGGAVVYEVVSDGKQDFCEE